MIRLLRQFAIGLLCVVGQAYAGESLTLSVGSGNTAVLRSILDKVSIEAFRRIGVNFRLLVQPSERALQDANSGESDGAGLRVEGFETRYSHLVRVPESYEHLAFVAFSKDPTIRLAKSWGDLHRYRVAFLRGWQAYEDYATKARFVQRVETPEQLFMMLESGRVDLALYTQADGQYFVRRMGLKGIQWVAPPLQEADMYLYLNRKHEALIPGLVKALREMKADGTFDRIVSTVRGAQ